MDGRLASARSSPPARGCRSETVRGFFATFGVKIHSFYGASEAGGISFDDSDEIGEDDTVGSAAAWRHRQRPSR